MAPRFTASDSFSEFGSRVETAIFSPSRSMPWCRDEAAPGQAATGGLYAHRVTDRTWDFSDCVRGGVHPASLFATTGKDGIPIADLFPGSQARAGSDRARRERCRISTAILQRWCSLSFRKHSLCLVSQLYDPDSLRDRRHLRSAKRF